ncbi:kinase-like domain-containing protein [Mrakia frigida]|uniref:kinase-like domain-containing protein n=1 Tax=Mrakia frigida TaxID=29902 RepID=UPI003FCC025D
MPRYLAWAVVTLPISAPRSRPPSLVTSPRSTPPTSPTLTDYSVMVTDRLGPNLETIFAKKGRRFRLETLLGIAVQLVERVEFIHSRGYLHRDLKPDNVVIGLAARDVGKLFIVDFGFAEAFKNGGVHIRPREGGALIGTQMFMSRAASQGLQSSRRDDLESLGYILLSFTGPLPWSLLARQMDMQYIQGGCRITPVVTDLLRRIEAAKDGYLRSASVRRTGDARRGDEAIASYFRRVASLAFEERPDYSALRNIFNRCRDANGFRRSSRIEFT